MKKNFGVIISFLTIFCLGFLIFRPAFATDAGLLNNGVQQFFDNAGNPLTSGKVYFYEVGTSTFKDTYTSSAATIVNTNPITLNAGGKAPTGGIYGTGLYRQLLKDRNNNVVWDAVTSPGGSGGSTPTAIGDGNLVGTTLPWSGLVAPNQYVFAYGQEISRTTYPDFYTAVTQQANVICSSSSNTLTGISDTTQINVGSPVELSLCVIAGSTVVSKTASTVTLSNPSSVSINAVATFFPYGNGNGTTTFNVPDLRGYAVAGRDNMGGSAAGRLTSTYFNTAGLGAVGGLQTITLSTSNLPAYTPAGTIGNIVSGGIYGGSSNTGSFAAGSTSAPNSPSLVVVTSTFTGTAQGGTTTPFSRVQPTITINYVVKITPDTSTSIATGVYSIGGMTGVISCGTGILCTGNIISFNGSVLANGSTGSVQYKNSDGSFGGSNNLIFISPNNLTLGAAGTSFLFDIYGSTSGRIRQTAPAVAGTPTVTWGNTSGTPAVTSTSPLVLNSTTGNLTISGQALTRTNDTNVTLTLDSAAATSLVTPSNLTLGWSGQLVETRGGTNQSTYATGDTLYASAANTLSKLTGNITTTRKFLRQTGSGAVSAAPAWDTITNADIPGAAFTASNDTNVTATLGGSPTTAVLSAMSFTLGWTGQLGLTRGGTNASLTASNGGIFYSTATAGAILAGTATANLPLLSGSSTTPAWATIAYPINLISGAILYGASTTQISSSALLTANQIMIGGGAGAAPSTFACATTTTVVHGGTPPTCSQIVAGDITTNTITNSNLSQVGAVTLKGNPTNATANVQDFTIQGLTNNASPSATLDYLVMYDHISGTLKSVTPGAIAGSSVAGVSAINTLVGGLTLNATSGLNIVSGGTTITITPDIATAANFEAGTANKLLDAAGVFTAETTTTYGTTTAFDFNTFINSKVTLTGNITTMNCSNMKQGQAGTIAYIQDGTGSRTAAFNTGTCSTVLKFAAATYPTLSTNASTVDILSYSCRSATYCVASLSKGYNP